MPYSSYVPFVILALTKPFADATFSPGAVETRR